MPSAEHVMKKTFQASGFLIGFAASAVFAQGNPVEIPQPTGLEQSFRGYLGGYSFWDVSPANTPEISHPTQHDLAGGVGTYSNPITLAVAGVLQGTETVLAVPAGTRFYLPRLRKYAIIEDICGDISNTQDAGCAAGKDGLPWMEIYIDGMGMEEQSAACAKKISGIQTFVMDPGPNQSVVVGEITQSGCNIYPDL